MSFYVAARPSGEPAVHPVDEVLPPSKLGIYGAQHVLAFYAGAVIVPILLAAAIGIRGDDLVYLISADLFTCGIASIIQAVGFWNVGVRLPLLQGVTFTAVAPMISIGQANGGGVDVRPRGRRRGCSTAGICPDISRRRDPLDPSTPGAYSSADRRESSV